MNEILIMWYFFIDWVIFCNGNCLEVKIWFKDWICFLKNMFDFFIEVNFVCSCSCIIVGVLIVVGVVVIVVVLVVYFVSKLIENVCVYCCFKIIVFGVYMLL